MIRRQEGKLLPFQRKSAWLADATDELLVAACTLHDPAQWASYLIVMAMRSTNSYRAFWAQAPRIWTTWSTHVSRGSPLRRSLSWRLLGEDLAIRHRHERRAPSHP